MTDAYSEKHSFQILRISEEEKCDIFFIKSTIPTLTFLQQCYRNNQPYMLILEFLNSVINKLESLVFWILSINEQANLDATEVEGIPLFKRQRMLKDMQILEILTDILYYPFKWHIIEFSKINETHKRELRIF